MHVNDDCALRWASAYGHGKTVKVLLAAGANVHAADNEALCNAAANGCTDVARLLCAAGADAHARDHLALRWALGSRHFETADALLAHLFRPELWRDKTPESVRAEAERLGALLGQDRNCESVAVRMVMLDIIAHNVDIALHAIREETASPDPQSPNRAIVRRSCTFGADP